MGTNPPTVAVRPVVLPNSVGLSLTTPRPMMACGCLGGSIGMAWIGAGNISDRTTKIKTALVVKRRA